MPGICKQKLERAAVSEYISSAKVTAKPNCLISVYTQVYVIVVLGRKHRKKACDETCQRRTHLWKLQDIPHLKKINVLFLCIRMHRTIFNYGGEPLRYNLWTLLRTLIWNSFLSENQQVFVKNVSLLNNLKKKKKVQVFNLTVTNSSFKLYVTI